MIIKVSKKPLVMGVALVIIVMAVLYQSGNTSSSGNNSHGTSAGLQQTLTFAPPTTTISHQFTKPKKKSNKNLTMIDGRRYIDGYVRPKRKIPAGVQVQEPTAAPEDAPQEQGRSTATPEEKVKPNKKSDDNDANLTETSNTSARTAAPKKAAPVPAPWQEENPTFLTRHLDRPGVISRWGGIILKLDFSSRFPLGASPQRDATATYYAQMRTLVIPHGSPPTAKDSLTSQELMRGKMVVNPTLRPGNTDADGKIPPTEHVHADIEEELHAPKFQGDFINQKSKCQNIEKGEVGGEGMEGLKHARESTSVALCTIVDPYQEPMALEWVQWHRILGVKRLHVYVRRIPSSATSDSSSSTGDNDTSPVMKTNDAIPAEKVLTDMSIRLLRKYMQPLINRSIVIPYDLGVGGDGRSPIDEVEALRQCTQAEHVIHNQEIKKSHDANDEGHPPMPFVGFLPVSDFLMLPQGNCVQDLVAGSMKPGLAGVVVLRTEVGTKDEWFDKSRTQLERSMYGMGVDPVLGTETSPNLTPTPKKMRGRREVRKPKKDPEQAEVLLLIQLGQMPSPLLPKSFFLGLGEQSGGSADAGSNLRKQRGDHLKLAFMVKGPGENNKALVPTKGKMFPHGVDVTQRMYSKTPSKPLSSLTLKLSPEEVGPVSQESEAPSWFLTSRCLSYKQRTWSNTLQEALAAGSTEHKFDMLQLKRAFDATNRVGRTDIRPYNKLLRQQHRLLLQSMGYKQLDRGVRSRGKPGAPGMHDKQKFASMFGLDPKNMTQLNVLTNQNIVDGVPGARIVQENALRPLNQAAVKAPSESMCSSRDDVLPTITLADGTTPDPDQVKEVIFVTYVRNRAKLTLEWVQWHRILGVKRFYIIDDESNDNLRKDLAPLIDAGIVDYRTSPRAPYRFIHFPVAGGQLDGYGQACEAEAPKKTWVGYFDPDEFISIPNSSRCIQDVIATAVQLNSNTASVALPWMHTGHLGEILDTFRTQFERTKFAPGKYDAIQRIRSIARSDLSYGMETAHKVLVQPPYGTGTTRGRPVHSEGWYTGISENSPELQDAVIYHYHSRSAGSWIQKMVDGFPDSDDKIFEEDFWEFSLGLWLGIWGASRAKNPLTAPPEHLAARHEILLKALGYDSN